MMKILELSIELTKAKVRDKAIRIRIIQATIKKDNLVKTVKKMIIGIIIRTTIISIINIKMKMMIIKKIERKQKNLNETKM